MLRVGLTGSIAVGKSFVASTLVKAGCHVLDADQTAREVVALGMPGLSSVVAEFGTEVLQPDGTLDRAKLAAIVFSDETKRLRLNALLHPLIISAQDEWLSERAREDSRGIGIVDAALMIETGSYKRFDKLIVVHCRTELQLARLLKRDKLTMVEAQRRIAAQMPQTEKRSYADYLIDTSGAFAGTRAQTLKIYRELRAQAKLSER